MNFNIRMAKEENLYKIARTICNGDQERSKKKQKMAKCDNIIICDFKMSLLTDMVGADFQTKIYQFTLPGQTCSGTQHNFLHGPLDVYCCLCLCLFFYEKQCDIQVIYRKYAT